jgi:hypothetical protein
MRKLIAEGKEKAKRSGRQKYEESLLGCNRAYEQSLGNYRSHSVSSSSLSPKCVMMLAGARYIVDVVPCMHAEQSALAACDERGFA